MTPDAPDGPPPPTDTPTGFPIGPPPPFGAYPPGAYYAPRPPSNGRALAWTAIGLSVTALLSVVALIGISIVMWWGPAYSWADDEYYDGSYSEADEAYQDDYYLEDSSLDEAVRQPCADMLTAAGQIALFSGAKDGSTSLLAFVDAGREVVDAIEGEADGQGDVLRWRDDWVLVLDEVERYANDVTAGDSPEFKTPMLGDEYSVIDRMYQGSPVGCEVPTTVAGLDQTRTAGTY